jgi:XRE family transcriptional regulator, regulator of sulfur utilization
MTKPANTSNIRKELGQRIRALRKRRGFTQEDMADRCSLHWTYIGGLERGERNPTLTTMKRVADGLKVDIHTLLGRPGREEAGLSTREKKEGNILKWLRKKDDTAVDLASRLVREVVHWQDRYKVGNVKNGH